MASAVDELGKSVFGALVILHRQVRIAADGSAVVRLATNYLIIIHRHSIARCMSRELWGASTKVCSSTFCINQMLRRQVRALLHAMRVATRVLSAVCGCLVWWRGSEQDVILVVLLCHLHEPEQRQRLSQVRILLMFSLTEIQFFIP